MTTIILILIAIWIVYQLGKASEREKNAEKDAKAMIENLRYRIDNSEGSFKSFKDAYSALILPGVEFKGSAELKERFKTLLLDEVRQEKELREISDAQKDAELLIESVYRGSSKYQSIDELIDAIWFDRLHGGKHGKYANYSYAYIQQLLHSLKES